MLRWTGKLYKHTVVSCDSNVMMTELQLYESTLTMPLHVMPTSRSQCIINDHDLSCHRVICQ